MKDVWVKSIGRHRGAPRVFLDGAQAVRAGFSPGERYEVQISGDGRSVVISKNADGSRTVVARKKGDRRLPVIDINSAELLAMFSGMDAVRVVVGADRVYLLPLASEIKKRERFARLVGKAAAGQSLALGSISHGVGLLSRAIRQGLREAGMECHLAFANEIREDLLQHAIDFNDAWNDGPPPDEAANDAGEGRAGGAVHGPHAGIPRTAALAVPMQEAIQDEWLMAQLPKLEVLELGLPCSGASRAGAAKRGLARMEDHPDVGHLVHAGLVILNRTQPALVVFENVTTYANTASAQILRQQLRDMGYDCHEAVLAGKDFGSLEDRVRWCMVAVTKGLQFDFDRLAPAVRVVRRLSDILDADIGPDDPRWRTMQYLKDKRERDEARGNRFKMQVLDGSETSVPVLRKGYAKGGSSDPYLRHPTNPDLLRKFTAAEHARIKGVPEHLLGDASEYMGHELLGQGIDYDPWVAVGRRIRESIHAACEQAVERGVDAPFVGDDDQGVDQPYMRPRSVG